MQIESRFFLKIQRDSAGHRTAIARRSQSVCLGMLSSMSMVQLERFESLSVTPAGPGQPPGLSPAMLPRPLGDDAERGTEAPKLAHPRNCSAKFMRVTVSAIPSQQVAKPLPHKPQAGPAHPQDQLVPGRAASSEDWLFVVKIEGHSTLFHPQSLRAA